MSKPIDFGRLSRLCDEVGELQTRVRNAAQEEFKPALKEVVDILREHVPTVTALSWQQWVPGFNDGEPCEFTMGGVQFSFEKDGKEYDFDELWSDNPVMKDGVVTKHQASILEALAEQIAGLEEASELAFGSDTEITLDITTGELTTKEYDCGY